MSMKISFKGIEFSYFSRAVRPTLGAIWSHFLIIAFIFAKFWKFNLNITISCKVGYCIPYWAPREHIWEKSLIGRASAFFLCHFTIKNNLISQERNSHCRAWEISVFTVSITCIPRWAPYAPSFKICIYIFKFWNFKPNIGIFCNVENSTLTWAPRALI